MVKKILLLQQRWSSWMFITVVIVNHKHTPSGTSTHVHEPPVSMEEGDGGGSLWRFSLVLYRHGERLHLVQNVPGQPPPTAIIAPPVFWRWFLAPAWSLPAECSPRARPSARSGPLYPLGSPETSRSSTWGLCGQNLKKRHMSVIINKNMIKLLSE